MLAIITLTTDFGTADSYVGQMKGVMLGLAPGAAIVDISHGVPPQDVVAGALMLDSAIDSFPDGAVHVAVVDPGVGGGRRPIAVRTERCFFVGPDNGLFTAALERHRPLEIVSLSNPEFHRQPVSDTFHGRDIFAPAAAHLANGVAMGRLGAPLADITQLDWPQPVAHGAGLKLRAIRVDRFGNIITNLTVGQFDGWRAGLWGQNDPVVIRIARHRIGRISRTFSDVCVGELLAYWGSGGGLEVAVRDGSAAENLGVSVGVELYIEPPRSSSAAGGSNNH